MVKKSNDVQFAGIVENSVLLFHVVASGTLPKASVYSRVKNSDGVAFAGEHIARSVEHTKPDASAGSDTFIFTFQSASYKYQQRHVFVAPENIVFTD
ncbi:hypothetical protein [Massilia endophytica]|uniref:hypothetical protein n=1 Tax=Massilia endophytica TaxID=2899220 RepID=UPI001E2EE70F|nr:hypothetical protein [Massilia endophytica]UGQ49159.1 hypothetical protein LSQ66_12045 [Massilia endophytica]